MRFGPRACVIVHTNKRGCVCASNGESRTLGERPRGARKPSVSEETAGIKINDGSSLPHLSPAHLQADCLTTVRDGALEIGSGGSVGPISKSGCEIEIPVGPISNS